MDDALTHIWRSAGFEIPCTPIGPEEQHESGRPIVKVRNFEGFEMLVHADELVSKRSNSAGVESAPQVDEPQVDEPKVDEPKVDEPKVEPEQRPNGGDSGADFADVTGEVGEAQQEKLRQFQALLAQVKGLAAGDDETLGAIIKAAARCALSAAHIEKLVSTGARKVCIPLKFAREVAAKEQESMRRREEDKPDARAERERIAAEKAERERAEKEAELARLFESVKALAENPDVLAEMEKSVHRLGVIAEGASIRGTYLAATSRLLRRQAISYARRGAPASGKNYLVDKVLGLFPSECIIRISLSSDRALVYLGNGPDDRDALKHKILLVPEAASLARRASGDEPVTAILVRTLISEGRIDYPVTVLVKNGVSQSIRIIRDGPVSLILTTARDNLEEELSTRMLGADADESKELTLRVIRAAWTGRRFEPGEGVGEWPNLQRWLMETMPAGGYEVEIPFASAIEKAQRQLIKRDPDTAPLRVRRDVPSLRAAIEASAVLHKARRSTASSGALIAEIEDYRHAFEAFDGGMAALYAVKSADYLSRALEAVVEVAEDQARKPGDANVSYKVSVGAVGKKLGVASKHTIDDRIKKLVDLGALELDPERRGGRGAPFYYRILKETLNGTASGHVFPTVEEVTVALEPGDGPDDDDPGGLAADSGEYASFDDAAFASQEEKKGTVQQPVETKDEKLDSELSRTVPRGQFKQRSDGAEAEEDLRPKAVTENAGPVNELSQGDGSGQFGDGCFESEINNLAEPSPFAVPRGKGQQSKFAFEGSLTVDGVEVVYCADSSAATALIAEMVADADGFPIALDIETAPLPAERAKLQALLAEQDVARDRKTKANREIKKSEKSGGSADALRAEVASLEARLHRLEKELEIAESAGLDPRKSSIRLCQIFGGGPRAVIIDVALAGEAALAPLNGVDVTLHNAGFDVAFLARAGVTLGETHDTLQAVKLTIGEAKSSLAQAVAHFCDHVLDKEEQTGNWSGTLTPAQLRYAARDVIWLWRLVARLYPDSDAQADTPDSPSIVPPPRRPPYEAPLDAKAEAYATANAVVPAFVRLNLHGVGFDLEAHDAAMQALAEQERAASKAYCEACLEVGFSSVFAERIPHNDPETGEALKAILADLAPELLASWPRVQKPWSFSTAKTELRKAAHLAPIVPLIGLAEARIARSQWGEFLPLRVAPDGRLYPTYRVAGAASGRSTASEPNIQGCPRDPRFRRMFVARPGYALVAADYGSMDLRTFAYFFEDSALAAVFTRDGDEGDPHTLRAHDVMGKPAFQSLDKPAQSEARSKAKATNFGFIYGIQAPSLVEQIWKLSPEKPIRVTVNEAQRLLDTLSGAYADGIRHRNEFAARCVREQRIVVGRDRFAPTGRIIPFRRLRRDQNPTTCSFAYPIQGINAVIAYDAIVRVDRALIAERLDARLCIFNHDELVLEAREDHAERAGVILKDAMESAYLDVFPQVTLKGLVEVKFGRNWAETKEKKPPPENGSHGVDAPKPHEVRGLPDSPEPQDEPSSVHDSAEARRRAIDSIALESESPTTAPLVASRPAPLEALDLYCCAGGATAGLRQAGFRVTGVDIAPQPNYCGDAFVQADALNYLATADLSRFAFIWASPPCQRFTALKHAPGAKGDAHFDLIAPTREALKRIGLPYVIENVEGAPLIEPFTLCGTMFDLVTPGGVFEIQRHCIFEASFPVSAPQCNHRLPVCGVYGGHFRDRRRAAGTNHRLGSNIPREHGLAAMQTPWMTVSEMSECIPPAYAKFIVDAWLMQKKERA